MTLKTKWIELIYNLATRSRKIGSFFTPLGALFFFLTIFSIVIISLQVDKLLGITDILPRFLSLILASLLFLVAFILIGWSVLTFLRAKGTPVPVSPPPQLVTTGPYGLYEASDADRCICSIIWHRRLTWIFRTSCYIHTSFHFG